MKKIGLLPRLICGIILGILVGATRVEFLTRLLLTFSGLFGNFLTYVIPLMIIGFVVPGIAELGKKAGKLLGLTTGLAYLFTVMVGIFTFVVASNVVPLLVSGSGDAVGNGVVVEPLFEIQIPAIMGVMTALVTAFILGIGISLTEGKTMLHFMQEFQGIIKKVVENIIIPFLPLHIAGIFAEMAFSGKIVGTLTLFGGVFVLIVSMHLLFIMIKYLIVCSIAKKNPIFALKQMMEAYFTAIGTQSSAATIPVTLKCIKKLKVSEEVAEFVAPLGAAIYLPGSTISLTICAIAVLALDGTVLTLSDSLPFIIMLGVTMVAAPGIPGGAVMAALGLLESMLGFTELQIGLMMALYIAQDSFGTAANVTSDGAMALIIDCFLKKSVAEQEQTVPLNNMVPVEESV